MSSLFFMNRIRTDLIMIHLMRSVTRRWKTILIRLSSTWTFIFVSVVYTENMSNYLIFVRWINVFFTVYRYVWRVVIYPYLMKDFEENCWSSFEFYSNHFTSDQFQLICNLKIFHLIRFGLLYRASTIISIVRSELISCSDSAGNVDINDKHVIEDFFITW